MWRKEWEYTQSEKKLLNVNTIITYSDWTNGTSFQILKNKTRRYTQTYPLNYAKLIQNSFKSKYTFSAWSCIYISIFIG